MGRSFTQFFILSMRGGNKFQAVSKALASRCLLRIRKQLTGLSAYFLAFILPKLIAHFLDQDQQRPAGALVVAAPLSNTPGPQQKRLRLVTTAELTKNQSMSSQRLRKQRLLAS